MLEMRRHPNFAQEPFAAEHGAKLRIEDLERDLAIVFRVACEIDRGHSSTADLAFDVVATGERGPELLDAVNAQKTTAGIVTSIVFSPRDRSSALNLARSFCTSA